MWRPSRCCSVSHCEYSTPLLSRSDLLFVFQQCALVPCANAIKSSVVHHLLVFICCYFITKLFFSISPCCVWCFLCGGPGLDSDVFFRQPTARFNLRAPFLTHAHTLSHVLFIIPNLRVSHFFFSFSWEGNNLGDSWHHVLTCVSEVERLQVSNTHKLSQHCVVSMPGSYHITACL